MSKTKDAFLDDLPELTELDFANNKALLARHNLSAEKLLGLYFPALDYGFVSLVDFLGNDAAIAQAARCSYGAGTKAVSDDRHLIRYLLKHKHTSPFEQCELKFHMRMPIFCARQIVRHRVANLNEISGRYSIMSTQYYTPTKDVVSAQSKLNKQGREESSLSDEIINSFFTDLEDGRQHTNKTYVKAIENDIARELARIDLPLSTYTEWYWKMDLHNLFHFLSLRCDSHAQYETRVFANLIAGIVQKCFPIAYEAWIDYAFCAKTFSKLEMQLLQDCLTNQLLTTEEHAISLGLSKREYQEFLDKINCSNEPPNFELDLSKALPPRHFEELAKQFVPEIKGK